LDILAYSACLGLILLLGGQPERVGAIILIVGSLATGVVSAGIMGSSTWDDLETGILAVDVVVLIALWAVALTSDRFWPYWVTAWQLLAVLVHLQMVFFANIVPSAYSYASMYLAFPMVLLMLFASVTRRLRWMEAAA
jgi:Zn-dependent protease